MTALMKGYAQTSAGQIHYRTLDGPAGSGAPVLFFHRTPVTSASFIRVMEHLDGWRRLVAFDTPGFGESFTPEAGTTMATFTSAFLEAIDALGIDRFHLVGHHTGAHFATEIALAAPDRALSLMLDGAMVLSAEQIANAASAAPTPPVIVDEDGAYAAGAWKFLRPYYTVFDQRCIHDEFVGALRSTFTRDACMALVRVHDMATQVARVTCPVIASAAQDDVFIGHIPTLVAALPSIVTRTYGAAGIAAPELQTASFCQIVRECAALAEG